MSALIDHAVPDALAATLWELGTATLSEASGRDCVLPARLRPAWPGARLVGRALPVRMPAGDNLPIHLALEQAVPGDVLVVDAEDAAYGYWGEVLTVAAQSAGVTGLVIDGGVRDVRELESLAFPVFSSHIALPGTVKASAGSIGAPIQWGHTTVARGDVVLADRDGVIALPASVLDEVLEAARARQATEAEYLARLREGATTMELYHFSRPDQR